MLAGTCEHLQVHVAHRRPERADARTASLSGSSSSPRRPSRSSGIGAHGLGDLALPERARPVVVDLDAVAVGIAEVDRLAHEVVGRAGEADPRRAPRARASSARLRPVGQQQREVEEPGAARSGLRARHLDELEQALLAHAERRAPAPCVEHVEADGAGGSTPASARDRRPSGAPRPCAWPLGSSRSPHAPTRAVGSRRRARRGRPGRARGRRRLPGDLHLGAARCEQLRELLDLLRRAVGIGVAGRDQDVRAGERRAARRAGRAASGAAARRRAACRGCRKSSSTAMLAPFE